MITVGRHTQQGAIYIGRGSALGNPFVIGRDGDRDAVCDAYEIWIDEQIERGNTRVLNMLNKIRTMSKTQHVILGCFCAPRRCHGDTIKRILEQS